MFFCEEAGPRGLLVFVLLAVIAGVLGSGGRRLGDKSGAKLGSQGCGKQNRGEMLFAHSGSSGGMKTEVMSSGLYRRLRGPCVEFVYEVQEVVFVVMAGTS